MRSLASAFALAAIVGAGPASADTVPDLPLIDGNWDARLFGQGYLPYGTAILSDGDLVYVGGNNLDASAGDVQVEGVAIWDRTTGLWSRLPGDFEGVYGWRVDSMALFEGDLYIAGNFTSIDGVDLPGLARWDGESWASVGSGVEGTPYRLDVMEGALYVFGVTKGDGLTFKGVARWDGDSWSVLPYEIGSGIRTLAVEGNLAWFGFGDSFSPLRHYTGETVTTMTWNIEHSSRYAPQFLERFDDKLYAGGHFRFLQPGNIEYIAQWSGSQWQPVGEGLPGRVVRMEANDDALYVVTLPVSEPMSVRRWDGQQWTNLGEVTGELSPLGDVAGLSVEGGHVCIAGSFGYVAGVFAPNAACWDEQSQTWSGVRDPRGPAFNGRVYDLKANQSGVYAGGEFTRAGGEMLSGIARWSNGAWEPLGDSNNAIWTGPLALAGRSVFAVGYWKRDGKEVYGISRWTGEEWRDIRIPFGKEFEAITTSKGKLYAAGYFYGSYPNYFQNRLAVWDGSRWTQIPAIAEDEIHAIAVTDNGDIFLAGWIDKINLIPVSRIGRWNGQVWSAMGPVTGGGIDAMVAIGNAIYIGGDFESVNGVPGTKGVAKWENGQWSAVGGLDGRVWRLATDGNHLYAEWYFDDFVLDEYAHLLLRWDDQGWEEVGPFNHYNPTLAARGGQVWADPFDDTAPGGIPSPNVIHWSSCDMELATCFEIASTTTTTLDTTTTTTTTTSTTTTSTTTTTMPEVTTTSSSTSTSLGPEDFCGDPNNDGSISSSDALFALRVSVGIDSCPLAWCDVNASNTITVADALGILRASVNLPVILICPTF